MSSRARTLVASLPAALWAAVIFVLSSDAGSSPNSQWLLRATLGLMAPRWLESLSPTQLDAANFVVRKAAHFTVYFVLACLVWLALRVSGMRDPRRCARRTLALAALYAATDELHQAFVATRTPSAADVLIDVSGAAAAAAVCALAARMRAARARAAPWR